MKQRQLGFIPTLMLIGVFAIVLITAYVSLYQAHGRLTEAASEVHLFDLTKTEIHQRVLDLEAKSYLNQKGSRLIKADLGDIRLCTMDTPTESHPAYCFSASIMVFSNDNVPPKQYTQAYVIDRTSDIISRSN